MNIWTKKSIELAGQRNYLDLLYKIYPMSVNLRREPKLETVKKISEYFEARNSKELIKELLKQEIFPIKDSYVAYLKRDKSAIERNPATVERLSGMLFEMGMDEIIENISQPKETNRQMGQLFGNWIKSGSIGVKITDNHNEMINYQGNIILATNDKDTLRFARDYLGYGRNKGLNFIGKFNGKYIVAEAKFLTDFGGHQNTQFDDAVSTMTASFDTEKEVIPIAVLDGVLYIKGNNKLYKAIVHNFDNSRVIISAVLLRDFLFSV